MLERFVVTVLPLLFLTILFGGGERFRRRHIDMDGDAPIQKTVFYASKHLILAVWAAMIMQAWGVRVAITEIPAQLKWAAVGVWAAGFLLLLIGRFELGNSFRIGRPRENTSLAMEGLFRFSRNPMYVGVYATLLASVLRTLNPILLLLAVLIVVVHHRIVLAEEEHLRASFGKDYAVYCRRVRRYL